MDDIFEGMVIKAAASVRCRWAIQAKGHPTAPACYHEGQCIDQARTMLEAAGVRELVERTMLLAPEPLYRQVWSVIEEFIVNAKPIDLDSAEGQARMQVVCALLATLIHSPHDLELGPE